MPKPKREKAGSFTKSECQKLQRLYKQAGAAYGSVRNLVKASNLSVSKVRQFLHSKLSYTNFTLATRKFERMKAVAKFRSEVWCMKLAHVDKLAKANEGVKYLLVSQDLFDRTSRCQKNENKRFQGNGSCIFDYEYKKKNSLENFWVDKGSKVAGQFTKISKAEGIQIYSTMSQ